MPRRAGGSAETVLERTTDSLAAWGRVTALLSLILSCLIGSLCIAFGVYVLSRKDLYTQTCVGQVKSAICVPNTDGANRTNSSTCHLSVTYKVSGIPYATDVTTIGATYVTGSTVHLAYNPQNPSQVVVQTMSKNWIGTLLLIFGVVSIAGSILWYFLTKRYKAAAAAGGISSIASLIF